MSEEKKPLELVAGVFMNPESELFETHAGREGIHPIIVMADAVIRYMEEVKASLPSPIQKGSADMFRRRPP